MTDFWYNDSELQMDTNLILYIEENDSINSVNNKLFIGWSNTDNDYYVRGRRQYQDFVPYAFHCKSTNKLYDLIKFIVGSNDVNITLYNYNNININDINDETLSYEFFEKNMDIHYEISGYDNVILKRKQFKKTVTMLKESYNWLY
jgi:hypothetical protein